MRIIIIKLDAANIGTFLAGSDSCGLVEQNRNTVSHKCFKAAKLAIEPSVRVKIPKAIHIQINNMTILSYIVKMVGETKGTKQHWKGN